MDSTLLKGRSQIEQEDKLLLRDWLEFLDCMQIIGRGSENLTLISKEIHSVLKEIKELNDSTSESKIGELESVKDQVLLIKLIFSHLNNAILRRVVNESKMEKRKQWSNKVRG
uniref:Uncharacterized protein n=1 Tax=Opuntia streptacantha TaxID=393608 RepID=A0A7C9EM94_OPUST